MKLQFPFVQLPIRFDAAALAAEVATVDEAEWIAHPQGFHGNSALPLIALNGDPDNEGLEGPMRPTPLLERLPYLRQTLAALGTVLGRTRLMRLSGHAEVSPHVDQAYYWVERLRVHVPIATRPTVVFHCGDAAVHMAAGECWIFDTWRMHKVVNGAEDSRIHLVVDTVGGDGFWEMVARGRPHDVRAGSWNAPLLSPDAAARPALACESFNLPGVMSPWEARTHIAFLLAEAEPHPNLPQVQQASMHFLHRWQALWAQYGDSAAARELYEPVLAEYRGAIRRYAQDISLRNSLNLAAPLETIVVRAGLSNGVASMRPVTRARPQAERVGTDAEFRRPVFIVSAPRSGSTLLFETLARAGNVFTIGDESHRLIEGIDALNPVLTGFASNRLDAAAATPAVSATLRARFRAELVDRDGGPPYGLPLRLLEKTPKNALRIAFLARMFPEAEFVFLHRDVRETLASMIEAWQSGRFRTYPQLPGWPGPPWSLLLVPGWRDLAGRPLPEIVAAQWDATLRCMLDDLAELPPARVHVARYAALLANPAGEVARLCAELDFVWDRPLDAGLPLSRYTLSPPQADKWRKHEAAIQFVLPGLAETIARTDAALTDFEKQASF
ncbi:MAG: sulfotransferase [Proteobacteria bacterium]|uniref:sulfotransferase n=1 Tax=Rudaea sp. TaxID=2136325 RepID=UPI0037830022|nr:sulfotransferase [Pseudomonadota bacterium]